MPVLFQHFWWSYLFNKYCWWFPRSQAQALSQDTEHTEDSVWHLELREAAGPASAPHRAKASGTRASSSRHAPQARLVSGHALFQRLLMQLCIRLPRLQWYLWCPSKYQVACGTLLFSSSNIFFGGNLRCPKAWIDSYVYIYNYVPSIRIYTHIHIGTCIFGGRPISSIQLVYHARSESFSRTQVKWPEMRPQWSEPHTVLDRSSEWAVEDAGGKHLQMWINADGQRTQLSLSHGLQQHSDRGKI